MLLLLVAGLPLGLGDRFDLQLGCWLFSGLLALLLL